jgi:hypothetical protein
MKPIKKAIEEPPPNVELIKIMFHTKALAKVPASPPSSSYCNSLPTFEGVEEAALSPKPTLGDNLHPLHFATCNICTSGDEHEKIQGPRSALTLQGTDDEEVKVMDVHPWTRTAAKEGNNAQTRAEHEAAPEATAASGVNIDWIMFREEGSSSGPDRMAPILRAVRTRCNSYTDGSMDIKPWSNCLTLTGAWISNPGQIVNTDRSIDIKPWSNC